MEYVEMRTWVDERRSVEYPNMEDRGTSAKIRTFPPSSEISIVMRLLLAKNQQYHRAKIMQRCSSLMADIVRLT